jgi:hypothetical protein
LATKLKAEFNENNIEPRLFLRKILSKIDLKMLEKMLDEKRGWENLVPTVVNQFKIVYMWLNDDKRLEKLDLNKQLELKLEEQQQQHQIVDNNKKKILNTNFDFDIDTIKLEYDDSVDDI